MAHTGNRLSRAGCVVEIPGIYNIIRGKIPNIQRIYLRFLFPCVVNRAHSRLLLKMLPRSGIYTSGKIVSRRNFSLNLHSNLQRGASGVRKSPWKITFRGENGFRNDWIGEKSRDSSSTCSRYFDSFLCNRFLASVLRTRAALVVFILVLVKTRRTLERMITFSRGRSIRRI